MKKILVFIIASILSLGCSDAQSWKKQNTGFSTQRGISGIHIVDNTKVWAWTWDDSTGIRCRDFCKTSNGGNLWTTGTVTFTNSTSYIIGNIHAFSDFVSLAAMWPTNGFGGLIVKTTDGGNTWSTINSPNFSGSFLNF